MISIWRRRRCHFSTFPQPSHCPELLLNLLSIAIVINFFFGPLLRCSELTREQKLRETNFSSFSCTARKIPAFCELKKIYLQKVGCVRGPHVSAHICIPVFWFQSLRSAVMFCAICIIYPEQFPTSLVHSRWEGSKTVGGISWSLNEAQCSQFLSINLSILCVPSDKRTSIQHALFSSLRVFRMESWFGISIWRRCRLQELSSRKLHLLRYGCRLIPLEIQSSIKSGLIVAHICGFRGEWTRILQPNNCSFGNLFHQHHHLYATSAVSTIKLLANSCLSIPTNPPKICAWRSPNPSSQKIYHHIFSTGINHRPYCAPPRRRTRRAAISSRSPRPRREAKALFELRAA